MRRNVLVAGLAVAVLGGLFLALPGVAEEPSPATEAVVPLELIPTERYTIPLEQDHLVIAAAEGEEPQQIPVRLRWTSYDCRVLEISEGGAREWAGRLDCYELDSDAPYTWAIWSAGPPLGMFRLLTNDSGENYLAWVRFSILEIAEVSRSRDKCVALSEHFLRQELTPIAWVPVQDLVPEGRRWGWNPVWWEINVSSVARDEAGNWTVKISGPDSPEVYTLVSENGQWRRQE